jgi:hypothetical protein
MVKYCVNLLTIHQFADTIPQFGTETTEIARPVLLPRTVGVVESV